MREGPRLILPGSLRVYGCTMAIKRVIRASKPEPEVMHNLVAMQGNVLIARCGVKAKKPKEGGTGNMTSFGHNCPDCDARTRAILAGESAT